MFLDELALTNFKCFQKEQVRFAKLTLLLGANSTGKSSILYAILGALQSDQFPLFFSANGSYVNMGDFRAVAHRHRKDREISIDVRLSGHALGDLTVRGTFTESSTDRMPVLQTAEYEDSAFKLQIRKNEGYKAEWLYSASDDRLIRQMQESEDVAAFYRALAKLVSQGLEDLEKSDTSPSFPDFQATPPKSGHFSFKDPRHFFRRADLRRYFALLPHASAAVSAVRDFAQHFNYVGSFRREPQRTYYQVSKADLKVSRTGENYIEQIAEWEDQHAPEMRKLKASLRKLALLQQLRTARLSGGRFEVKVQFAKAAVSVSLADIGFGVSQVLPILVADLQLPKGSTLAVSQPEIHLHPSAQAGLADHFVDRIRSDDKRYIIETHSEYLLNRLRLLIAQGTLSEEDVSIVYLTSDGSRAESHDVVFTKDGQITGAPKDFFQTYMMDVMNLALTASR